jgi:type IV secretion system protein VirB10
MKNIDSPTGIDLRPEPPEAVRLSKRAGIIGLVIVTFVVGLAGYGVATRRQRTAAAIERADPRNLTAASDAGKMIAAQIPVGVMIGSPQGATRPEGSLQPPESGKTAGPPPLRQSMSPVRPHSAPPSPPPARELTPEEKARAAAYRQELEAMAAPTATRAGFSGVSGLNQPGLPTRENDLANMTALLRAMRAPNGQRAAVDPGEGRTAAARLSLDADGDEGEDYDAQNLQDRKEGFLAESRNTPARENYSNSSRVRPLSRYEIKEGWDIPAVLEQALNSDLPGEIRALSIPAMPRLANDMRSICSI